MTRGQHSARRWPPPSTLPEWAVWRIAFAIGAALNVFLAGMLAAFDHVLDTALVLFLALVLTFAAWDVGTPAGGPR